MAVPSSGSLSLFGLAKEKTHDDYNNSIPPGTWQQYFFSYASLTDATTGAGNYDATNTNSANRPNDGTPHEMGEWYGYDHDATVSSSDCIQVVHSSFASSNTNDSTGCSSSTSISASSGAAGPIGGHNLQYINRYARYRNITGATKNYNIRLYRSSTSCGTLKVYKGYNANTFGYSTGGDMSLVHTKSTTGYSTYTGTIEDDDELLVLLEHSNTMSCNSTSISCTVDNLYYHGSGCSYNGSMLNVPVLGSASSSAYTYLHANSAFYAGYNSRTNSSAWANAYIHQCQGSMFTVGNNIYQSNGTTGSKVLWGSSGWRCFAYPTSNWSLYGYPGTNDLSNFLAVYDSGVQTYNIESTWVETGPV